MENEVLTIEQTARDKSLSIIDTVLSPLYSDVTKLAQSTEWECAVLIDSACTMQGIKAKDVAGAFDISESYVSKIRKVFTVVVKYIGLPNKDNMHDLLVKLSDTGYELPKLDTEHAVVCNAVGEMIIGQPIIDRLTLSKAFEYLKPLNEYVCRLDDIDNDTTQSMREFIGKSLLLGISTTVQQLRQVLKGDMQENADLVAPQDNADLVAPQDNADLAAPQDNADLAAPQEIVDLVAPQDNTDLAAQHVESSQVFIAEFNNQRITINESDLSVQDKENLRAIFKAIQGTLTENAIKYTVTDL